MAQSRLAVCENDSIENLFANFSLKAREVPTPQVKKSEELSAPHSDNSDFVLFLAVITVVLTIGWRMREESLISAESGIGYGLGIIGGLLMLFLSLYPLRKKMKILQKIGTVKVWFFFHMLCGVLGPVAILFHANFKTGSFNSTIVLFATLIVSMSGIVGRYVYSKIHYGLYGKLKNFSDLQEELKKHKSSLLEELTFYPKLEQKLLALDELIAPSSTGLLNSVKRLLFTGVLARWTQLVLFHDLRKAMKDARNQSAFEETRNSGIVKRYISLYISKVISISYFRFYEKFFSMWHLLHLPLFSLLIIFGTFHVVIVHMF